MRQRWNRLQLRIALYRLTAKLGVPFWRRPPALRAMMRAVEEERERLEERV